MCQIGWAGHIPPCGRTQLKDPQLSVLSNSLFTPQSNLQCAGSCLPTKRLSSSSSCSWKPNHGPVFPRDSACPAARVWRCQQTWAGPGVPVCCRWQRCHKQGHPLCLPVHGASWCHTEMTLPATVIKRHSGGGAGKLLSIKMILGQGISPFSFHFPPAAEGVGISRDTHCCMRKIPLLRLMNPPDGRLPVLRVVPHVYPPAARPWQGAPAGINLQ